jgi:hypothetical protein
VANRIDVFAQGAVQRQPLLSPFDIARGDDGVIPSATPKHRGAPLSQVSVADFFTSQHVAGEVHGIGEASGSHAQQVERQDGSLGYAQETDGPELRHDAQPVENGLCAISRHLRDRVRGQCRQAGSKGHPGEPGGLANRSSKRGDNDFRVQDLADLVEELTLVRPVPMHQHQQIPLSWSGVWIRPNSGQLGSSHFRSVALNGRLAAVGSHQKETPLAIFPVADSLNAMSSEDAELQAHCGQGKEWDRLGDRTGAVELERTEEILQRRLPAPPAVVADIGGGPGRYALWLAELGYTLWSIEISSVCMCSNFKERAGPWCTPKSAMLAT